MGAAGQRFDRLERTHRLGGQGRSLLRDEHRFSGHVPVRGLWQGSGCARMKEKLEARKEASLPVSRFESVRINLRGKIYDRPLSSVELKAFGGNGRTKEEEFSRNART